MPIIAAVDGETVPDPVVEVGHELAHQFDEELVVLHVMPQELFEDRQSLEPQNTDEFGRERAPGVRYGAASGRSGGSKSRYTIEDGQDDAAEISQQVVDGTIDESARVTVQGRVGDSVKEILDEAERREARYLVIGGRKRTPVGKAIFGSTTQSVLLNADRPVMAVMQAAE